MTLNYSIFTEREKDYDYVLYPAIDECANNPCQNGGVCLDDVNGYKCTCKAGYTGSDCEIGRPTYNNEPLHNNTFNKTGIT